jgi:iron(III) transport system permease protein
VSSAKSTIIADPPVTQDRVPAMARFSVRSLALGLTLAVVSYLVLVPLLMLLYASVRSTEDKLPFESTVTSLGNYVAVFTSPSMAAIFLDTFLFTAGSLAVGLPVAILLAWLLERTAIRGRAWIAGAILVPMTIPSLLSAMAWIQLLDPRTGFVNVVARSVLGLSNDTGPFDIYTLYGMCFVQGLRLVPSAYLMIAASFRAMDPSLEEQSAMAGRGIGQTTFRITLPIMRPALLAALIYFIIVVIESFDIPGLLGFTARIRVLSTAIYWATHSEVGLPDYGLASALGTIILAAALLLMWIYQRLTAHQERFATITGKGYRPRQVSLGVWSGPAMAFCLGYIFVAVLLPFVMLLWTSVQPFYAVPSAESLARVTFEGYLNIWRDRSVVRAMANTTVLALVTSLATIVLAVLVSWFVVRRHRTGHGLANYLATVSFLPQCVPSIVIGLAFIFVYVRFPIPIYGTLWIIALALTTRYLAFSSRATTSALMQVHGELEEASQMSGAQWTKTLRRITMPLLAPAMINVFLWVAVHAMQELSMALMLYNPDTVVVSTMIWSMWQNGRTADAAVLGVILILLSALLLVSAQAVSFFRGRAHLQP